MTGFEMASATLDGNELNASATFACARFDKASIQPTLTAGTAGTAVLTVKRSVDGVNFVALSTPATAAVGSITEVDCSAFAYLRVEVTTAEGGSCDLALSVLLRDND